MTDLILVAASALLAFSLRNVIILGEGNDSTASFLISVGFIAFICISTHHTDSAFRKAVIVFRAFILRRLKEDKNNERTDPSEGPDLLIQ